jgi:hypothetical protein
MWVGPSLTLQCRTAQPPAELPGLMNLSVLPKPCCSGDAPRAPRLTTAVGQERAGPSQPRAAMDTVEAIHRVWQFHAGAPLAFPPAVTSDGSVVVATSDGYIDLLRPDGTLRWSYTVDGAVPGAAAVGQRSLVVGTSSGQLVSLSFDGTARWIRRIPDAITTRIQPEGRGLVFFGVASGRVYGALPNGAAVSFDVGGQVSAGPIRLDSGWFALGTSAGRVVLFDRTGIKRTQTVADGALLSLFVSEDSMLYVLSTTSLVAVDRRGQTLWSRGGVRAAARAGSAVVVLHHGGNDLEWVDRTGRTQRRIRLAGQASDAPTLAPDGLLYLPRIDGRLDGLSEDGAVQRSLEVSSALLLSPVIDAERSRLIAAGADGTVVAARLGSISTPRPP